MKQRESEWERELCVCIELFHRIAEGRKLKIIDTGPLNFDVRVLNFQNHADLMSLQLQCTVGVLELGSTNQLLGKGFCI